MNFESNKYFFIVFCSSFIVFSAHKKYYVNGPLIIM